MCFLEAIIVYIGEFPSSSVPRLPEILRRGPHCVFFPEFLLCSAGFQMLSCECVVVSSANCFGHYNFIFMQCTVVVVFENVPSELVRTRH